MAAKAEKAEKIKALFRKYDKSGDGFIESEELESVLKFLGGFQKSEISVVFSHIDKNGDGKISTDEFVDWVMSGGGGGRKADTRAVTMLAPAEGDSVGKTFYTFCGSEHSNMDGKSFLKLCRDCHFVDKKLTTTDVDLIFAKVVAKGHRRIGLEQFEKALELVAAKRGVDKKDIVEVVIDVEPPQVSGTKAENVRLFDDKETYTGTAHVKAPSANTRPRLSISSQDSQHRPPSSASTPVAADGQHRPPSRATTPVAAQAGAGHGQQHPRTHEQVFMAFTGGSHEMCGRTFAKVCKDSHLIDKKFTTADVDLIFQKTIIKGTRTISFYQFESACRLISEKKGTDYDSVVELIKTGGAGTGHNHAGPEHGA